MSAAVSRISIGKGEQSGAGSNRYLLLRLRILVTILGKGKLSLRKITNALHCLLAHLLKLPRSGRLPFVMTFDLTNECNARCGVCRTPAGKIIDRNPAGGGYTFETGSMPFELFADIIDQSRNELLMAVLYVNGEPLLYERLDEVIRYASARRVATMISTNGFLLSAERSQRLIASGLDFIKIAVSGFSRHTARIQHRSGDIEKVKAEMQNLVELNREKGRPLIIMMDYISYRYNDHELTAARSFCDELGIIFNVRPGIYMGVEEIEPPPEAPPADPEPSLCDWPWKMLSINWNGDLYACCDHMMWSGAPRYAEFAAGKTSISDVWNGPTLIAFRKIHAGTGRSAMPACASCRRKGTAFTL